MATVKICDCCKNALPNFYYIVEVKQTRLAASAEKVKSLDLCARCLNALDEAMQQLGQSYTEEEAQ